MLFQSSETEQNACCRHRSSELFVDANTLMQGFTTKVPTTMLGRATVGLTQPNQYQGLSKVDSRLLDSLEPMGQGKGGRSVNSHTVQ